MPYTYTRDKRSILNYTNRNELYYYYYYYIIIVLRIPKQNKLTTQIIFAFVGKIIALTRLVVNHCAAKSESVIIIHLTCIYYLIGIWQLFILIMQVSILKKMVGRLRREQLIIQVEMKLIILRLSIIQSLSLSSILHILTVDIFTEASQQLHWKNNVFK